MISLPNLNLHRYHYFMMFFLFTAVGPVTICNLMFPAFGNVTPLWRCGNEGDFTQDCHILQNCSSDNNTEIEFQSPFLSLVQDLELYCGREVYISIIGTMQMAGVVLGSLFFGPLSDRFGRKTISLLCGIGLIVLSTVSTLISDWFLIGVARFAANFFNAGLIVGTQTLMIEELEPQQRIVACAFFWSSGWARAIYSLTTYVTRDWQNAIRVVNIGSLPVLGVIYLWIQESPRWLVQRNRVSDAEQALRRIDRFNGIKISVPLVKPQYNNPSKRVRAYGYRDLFSTVELRKRAFLAAYFYFTCAFVSFGIDMASGNLAGNFFINQALIGLLAEFIKPSIFLIDTYWPAFSRRIYHQLSLGIVLFILIIIVILTAVPETGVIQMVITALAICGRCLIEFQWDAVMLYGTELFPTVIRNSGLAFSATAGRIGDTIAPQAVYLSDYWKPASYVIFAASGLLSIVLSVLFAPDTKGKELSDTLLLEIEMTEMTKKEPLLDGETPSAGVA